MASLSQILPITPNFVGVNTPQTLTKKTFGDNVGIGTTPSNWFTSSKVLQLLNCGIMAVNPTEINFLSNAYLNSNASAWIYQGTGAASRYLQNTGAHAWYTAPSGTAGNTITFTQTMTLNESGNLGIGIGTGTPQSRLHFNGAITVGDASTSNYKLISGYYDLTIHISTSGNDTTGDGTYANPYLSISRALRDTPLVLFGNVTIVLKNGTYNNFSCTITGRSNGVDNVKLRLAGESAGGVTLTGDSQLNFNRNTCRVELANINITHTSYWCPINFNRCLEVEVYSSVNVNVTSGGSGQWRQKLSYDTCANVRSWANVTISDGVLGGYGAVVLVSGPGIYTVGGTITKLGTRDGNAAISVIHGATAYLNSLTLNNFNVGLLASNFHYGDTMGGQATLNGVTISNCQYAIYFSDNGWTNVTNYSTTFTNNTYNWWYTNGWGAGSAGITGNLLLGYNQSNGNYKLQVNSQIFATSGTIATSDGRYKENIAPLTGALSIVNKLNPVQFNWKEHPVHNFDTKNPTIGFIAQEVQQVLGDQAYVNSIVKKNYYETKAASTTRVEVSPAVPEVLDDMGRVIVPAQPAVYEERVVIPAETEEFLGIAESNLVSLLTAAIKELSSKVEALELKLENRV